MTDAPPPVDPAELARQRRRWGCVRNLALLALVLVALLTVIAVASGGDDETTTVDVEVSDAAFDVEIRRLEGEPVAIVKNGGQVQVLRLVGPEGGDVGYCADAEIFVDPDAGAVYDIDGVRIAGPSEDGLSRFDFVPVDDTIEIDIDLVQPAGGRGLIPAVSSADPAVQACVAAPDSLEFAPPAD